MSPPPSTQHLIQDAGSYREDKPFTERIFKKSDLGWKFQQRKWDAEHVLQGRQQL